MSDSNVIEFKPRPTKLQLEHELKIEQSKLFVTGLLNRSISTVIGILIQNGMTQSEAECFVFTQLDTHILSFKLKGGTTD